MTQKLYVLGVGDLGIDTIHKLLELHVELKKDDCPIPIIQRIPLQEYKNEFKGLDFAAVLDLDYDLRYLNDNVFPIYADDMMECGKILHEKFFDADIVFIIADVYDFSLASLISTTLRKLGVVTIGILITTSHSVAFEFVRKAMPFYNTAFISLYPNAEEYAKSVIKFVSDLILKSNVGIDEIKKFLNDAGHVVLRTGYFGGNNKIKNTTLQALGDYRSLKSSQKFLMKITSGNDFNSSEISEAVEVIKEKTNPNIQIILGHVIDKNLGNSVKITFIAKK